MMVKYFDQKIKTTTRNLASFLEKGLAFGRDGFSQNSAFFVEEIQQMNSCDYFRFCPLEGNYFTLKPGNYYAQCNLISMFTTEILWYM